ncbi:MAG: HlyD family type I secretion periplasmic adaptor subunit [Allorhizobium sp.]
MSKPKLELIGNVDADSAKDTLKPANSNRPGAVGKPALPRRDDQEFLPAALEILETPPSPVRMAMIVFFALFVVIALVWTYFGRFDIVATAQGKIQPPGRVKIVQPVETARVRRIAATNGMKVAEGDILIEFEPQDAQADVEALKAATSALLAEILRRGAALAEAMRPRAGEAVAALAIEWPADLPVQIREREMSVLKGDLAQLEAALMAIEAQRALKESEQRRLREMITAQSALVANLQDRVDMRSTLATSGSGSRASLIDGKEVLLKEEAVLTGHRGALREAEASLRVLAAEREKLLQSFLTENTQKRADAGKALEEASQRLIKARSRLGHMTLRSPADGVVQASAVYTIGQVVTPAQEIMRIVPQGEALEIEAYLPNKDIGFVQEGQEVAVKVESFPFTRYGLLAGKVTRIARDAIPQADAASIEGNPAKPAESMGFAGAQRMQNLVFPITITIEKPELVVDGRRIPMSPGMTVTAEIKTGSRRIIEYLFSPLVEVSSEAMRER